MIDIPAYHRMIWFHNRIMENDYPNARMLSEHFEISARQAQRDIEYLRDSMNAPLVYCAKKRGYAYHQEYTLPHYFLSETEKGILHAMAAEYAQIGAYGYTKYAGYAAVLTKMSGSKEKPVLSSVKEPYLAELRFLGERTSVAALDCFVCQRKCDGVVWYAFYDPDIFMSVLLGSHLKFQVLRPKWFKSYLKDRLTDILSAL